MTRAHHKSEGLQSGHFLTHLLSCRYYVLDMSKSINDNLAHKMVIEYPTIYVVLKDHWVNYRADEPGIHCY